jgi:hypothetical protein
MRFLRFADVESSSSQVCYSFVYQHYRSYVRQQTLLLLLCVYAYPEVIPSFPLHELNFFLWWVREAGCFGT